nr:ribonuclease Oy-like protein [Crepidula fornicata]
MGETSKLVCFFLILCFVTHGTKGVSVDGSAQLDKHWDILILTQSWPPAVCIFVENEDKKCDIPSNITSWIIHGLWPTLTGTEGPNYCNNSWKFDINEVKTLRPKLDWNWPASSKGETVNDFWAHEWDKHGTCAAELPALNTEMAYFNTTLGLHFHYNISKILMESGIIPIDDRAYKAEDILDVLKKNLGFYPSISCVKDKNTEKYYLEQVEICLTKTFQLTDCSSHTSAQHLPSLHDLLFRSELLPGTGRSEAVGLEGYIHDCNSPEVYYKPLPPTKSMLRV